LVAKKIIKKAFGVLYEKILYVHGGEEKKSFLNGSLNSYTHKGVAGALTFPFHTFFLNLPISEMKNPCRSEITEKLITCE
jgi:hypothetical protein